MPGKRQKLSRKIVEGVTPAARDQFLWDSEVVGFGVRVRPGGHRGYILQYRFAGRARQYQIGAHGSPWTVETARDRAKVLQGLVAAGEDPQEAKQGSRKELTVAQLCDQYLAEGLATRKKTSLVPEPRAVSVLKPLCGNDAELERNLESFFEQDHPQLELVFGVVSANDPALAVVERVRMRYPGVPCQIVVHDGAALLERHVAVGVDRDAQHLVAAACRRADDDAADQVEDDRLAAQRVDETAIGIRTRSDDLSRTYALTT